MRRMYEAVLLAISFAAFCNVFDGAADAQSGDSNLPTNNSSVNTKKQGDDTTPRDKHQKASRHIDTKSASANSKAESKTVVGGPINWDAPSKHDIVERAVSDGMTDPAKIVEWAKNYKVKMTVEEVVTLKKQLEKQLEK